MNNTTTAAPATVANQHQAKAAPKRRKQRKAIHTADESNRPLVLVPMANSPEYARILLSDYTRITEGMGYSECWQYNNKGGANSYVRLRLSKHQRGEGDWGLPVLPTHIPIARLVLNIAPGVVARYRDGNRLNLVADNLYTEKAEDVEYPGKDDSDI